MHLLVIEDDARLVRLLRRLLTQDRHTVETAETADEGLEVAGASPGLDAVILGRPVSVPVIGVIALVLILALTAGVLWLLRSLLTFRSSPYPRTVY